MKYIFIAHSHTLCLSDIGTIDYLELNVKDVIFLTTRSFSCDYLPKGCTVYDANSFYKESQNAYLEQNHGIRRKKIKYLDSVIEHWIQDTYELFLPHMGDPYAMLLATNKKCKKVSFIQESAFSVEKRFESYLSSVEILKRKFKALRIFHTLRFYGMNWYVDGQFKQTSIDTYSLYPEFFKYIPSNNHRVKWPHIYCDFCIDNEGTYFIMDGYVKNGMAESDIYLSQCKDMINQFHGTKNYIKFHPNQTQEECSVILSFFQNINAEINILSQSIPFELYISNGKNLRIIGMTSTLLFFAKKQGHDVTSCDSWMMESAKFKKFHDDGMPLFHEYFADITPTVKNVAPKEN